MKKEHFEFVYNQFRAVLDSSHSDNARYYQDYPRIKVTTLYIERVDSVFHIIGHTESARDDRYVFVRIPTLKQAEEIIQHFKETEVLFA